MRPSDFARVRLALAVLVLAGALAAGLAVAQETVEEPSTKKRFPATVTLADGEETFSLPLTGTAVRKKFIVKVYAVAHHMAGGPFASEDEALVAALAGGTPRQLTLHFARGVGADKIQGAFREGFEKNASVEEGELIRDAVEQFAGYFDGDVAEDEQYVLRWMPGGTVTTVVAGEEKPAIENEAFARVLWRIWLGEKAIVDRKKLVRLAVAEDAE
ncbi:MAG: chalcone isomerase family protein [Candidatus Krumholzibacteria bacterium]|nr:chalcone isomerase family protein [Candidatus Krumholzibacteria bacterium]